MPARTALPSNHTCCWVDCRVITPAPPSVLSPTSDHLLGLMDQVRLEVGVKPEPSAALDQPDTTVTEAVTGWDESAAAECAPGAAWRGGGGR